MKRDPRVCLEDVIRSAEVIADYVAGTDVDGYLSNSLLQDGVERRFISIGEALNTLKGESPALAARILDLPNAVGLRNFLTHQYESIEPKIVWYAAVDELPGLRRSVQSLLAELGRDVAIPDLRLADDVLVLVAGVVAAS